MNKNWKQRNKKLHKFFLKTSSYLLGRRAFGKGAVQRPFRSRKGSFEDAEEK